MFIVRRESITRLLEVLEGDGYTTVGPTIRDGAIVYDVIHSLEDLPVGWTDEQEGGTYRLRKRDDDALFGYVVGPHSWKKYLFPPERRIGNDLAELTMDALPFGPVIPLLSCAFVGWLLLQIPLDEAVSIALLVGACVVFYGIRQFYRGARHQP